jgi:hypothetical protein
VPGVGRRDRCVGRPESTLIAISGLLAVIALLVPILLLGLVPGIDRQAFIAAFEQGFNSSLPRA